MQTNELHTGKLVQQKLHDDGRTVTWLAQKLNCSRTNVYLIFKKQYVDCETLMRISLIMGYDFFEYLSKEYRRKINSEGQE